MVTGERSNRVAAILSGLLILIVSVIVGIIVGGLAAKWVFPSTSGMGWDQLAHVLGGFMLGGLAGLVLGVVLVARLSSHQRWRVGLVMLTAIAVLVVVLRLIVGPAIRESTTPDEPTTRPLETTKPVTTPPQG